VTLPTITDRHHRNPGRHPGKGMGWGNGIKGMVQKQADHLPGNQLVTVNGIYG